MGSVLHSCARWYIIVLNALFLLFFLACAIICGLITWHPEYTKSFTREHIYSQTHEYQTKEQTEEAVKVTLDIFGPLVIGAFWASLFGIFLCLLGIVAVGKKSRHILWFYIIAFSAVVIVELATVILFFARPYLFYFHIKTLVDNLVVGYVSEEDMDPKSRALNYFMTEYQCCGSNNFSDFENATLFKQYRQDQNIAGPLIPTTCCALEVDLTPVEGCSITTMTEENSNIHRGCWLQLLSVATAYGTLVAYGWIGALVFQLTIIVASAHMLWHKQHHRAGYNQWYMYGNDHY